MLLATSGSGIPRVHARMLGSVAQHSTVGENIGKGSRCAFSRKTKFSFLATNCINTLLPTATLHKFRHELTTHTVTLLRGGSAP